jgi:hypothetical protein
VCVCVFGYEVGIAVGHRQVTLTSAPCHNFACVMHAWRTLRLKPFEGAVLRGEFELETWQR